LAAPAASAEQAAALPLAVEAEVAWDASAEPP
jgi:hypothetical protein